jgi:hypothetical protein
VDAIKSQEINLIVNTPSGKLSKYDDSYIRKAAINYKIPYITTLAGALAAARGIGEIRPGPQPGPVPAKLSCRHQVTEGRRIGAKSLFRYHARLARRPGWRAGLRIPRPQR